MCTLCRPKLTPQTKTYNRVAINHTQLRRSRLRFSAPRKNVPREVVLNKHKQRHQ
jgi:hypothetical protein